MLGSYSRVFTVAQTESALSKIGVARQDKTVAGFSTCNYKLFAHDRPY